MSLYGLARPFLFSLDPETAHRATLQLLDSGLLVFPRIAPLPVPVMGLIEVIPGLPTSDETTKRACAFAESLGKEVVLAGDEPGFVVNRILIPMLNEAIFVLGAGMGSAS